MDIALIITAGRSDLQVLMKRHDGVLFRAEVSNERDFHEALLLEGEALYCLDDSPVALDTDKLPREASELAWNTTDGGFEITVKGLDCFEPVIQEDQLVLVPAKLAPVIHQIQSHCAQNGLQVTAVLVLATHRDDDALPRVVSQREPVAAGPVLAKWLASIFNLEAGIEPGPPERGQATWINYLDGKMEVSGLGYNYPVNRVALDRIDTALALVSKEGIESVILSLGGGVPEFKPPVMAAARMRFPQCYNLFMPQFGSAGTLQNIGNRIPDPTDAFNIRRSVCHHIRKANFSSAWALAQELEHDPREQNWTNWIRWASEFIGGINPEFPSNKPAELKTVAEILRNHPSRALFVAFGCEAALWHGDVLQAARLACSFAEIAIRDAIAKSLPEGCSIELNSSNSIYAQNPECLNGWVQRGLIEHKKGNFFEFMVSGFIRKSQNSNDSVDRRELWFNWFAELDCGLSNGGLLAETLRRYIKRLDYRMYVQGKTYMTPRALRNALEHHGMGKQHREFIVQAFPEAGLWNLNAAGYGDRFINLADVADTLYYLGITQAGGLFEQLLQALERMVLGHRVISN